jgi:hypothetical protein
MIVLKASSDAITHDVTSMMLQDDDKMAAGTAGNCFATELAFQSSSFFIIIVFHELMHMHQNWCQYDCQYSRLLFIVNITIRMNSMSDISFAGS